jgi:hypothetical protein
MRILLFFLPQLYNFRLKKETVVDILVKQQTIFNVPQFDVIFWIT